MIKDNMQSEIALKPLQKSKMNLYREQNNALFNDVQTKFKKYRQVEQRLMEAEKVKVMTKIMENEKVISNIKRAYSKQSGNLMFVKSKNMKFLESSSPAWLFWKIKPFKEEIEALEKKLENLNKEPLLLLEE